MFSTWRSTKESHEHSAMPTQGTHICQVVADAGAIVAEERAVVSVMKRGAYQRRPVRSSGAGPSARIILTRSMSLAPGARFGPYEITSALDSGGMGEVYRARDSRLKRDVAIKVLPDRHRFDPERRARFEREAHALAAVNHPNIATILGVEDAEGMHAIVMELVDGPTLADRLASTRDGRGLPLRDAVPLALQIVDALEAAHERGIIHRDLKPSNIKIRPDGTVKVLDFGLAKALDDSGDSDVNAATVTVSGAAAVGTPCYMSPEQARGQAVDRRTDVWAFGCVLYEMLTGRRAFDGPTSTDVIAGVLEREPDYEALPPDTPRLVRRLLQRCLAKDLRRRLRDIADARIDLDDSREAPAHVDGTRPGTRRSGLGAVLAIAIIVLLTGALVAWRLWSPTIAGSRQFVLLPPDGGVFGGNAGDRTPPLALSPDGKRLAFLANVDSRLSIWVRSLDSLEAVPVAGTERPALGIPPAWSPDGSSIAFFAEGKLKRVGVQGGAPVPLADAPAGYGIAWSREGTIVFAPSPNDAILRVPETGGTPVPVTRLAEGDLGHVFPQFLPDGRHFVYLVRAPKPRKGIYIGSIDSIEERFVRPARERALYAHPGYLLFLDEGKLLAQTFDTSSFTVSGDPVLLTESVAYINTDGRASMDVSPGGTLAFRVSGIRTARQPIWVDRTGKTIGPVGEPGDYSSGNPRLSPDGKRVAVELHDLRKGTGDLWLVDLDRQLTTRFTSDGLHHTGPVWSPDGRELVFTGRPDGGRNLHRKAIDSASDEPLLPLASERVPNDWSPDGDHVLFEQGPNDGQRDLWTLAMPSRTPAVFLKTADSERRGKFSPDGRWVAYISDESGRDEVYVRSFPGAAQKTQISSTGGSAPHWNRNGNELIFVGPKNVVYAVSVRTGGAVFSADVPRPLFTAERFTQATFTTDGERFFIVPDLPPGLADSAPPITVVEDWTSLLRQGS
jgi:Tol biopolymer transport system component